MGIMDHPGPLHPEHTSHILGRPSQSETAGTESAVLPPEYGEGGREGRTVVEADKFKIKWALWLFSIVQEHFCS